MYNDYAIEIVSHLQMASATNDPGGSAKESSLRVIQKGADDFFDSLDEVSDVINCSLCRFTCSRYTYALLP